VTYDAGPTRESASTREETGRGRRSTADGATDERWPPPAAVLFDWGGTLTPWHTVDVHRAWLAVAKVADPHRADEVARRLTAAESEVWVRSRDEHRSGTVTEVFDAAGLEPTEAVLAAHYAEWEAHTYIDPDVPPLITGLRERGLRVGVLSNTLWPREAHERFFARDGVLELFDGAVYTSEIPHTKPHREAFRAAALAVGISDLSQCVYVGDRLYDDVWGAQQAGMRAVHVPHSEIPEYQRGHTEGVPDATVHRLGEVLGVIDRWLGG
jgi:putative hydrolase of the HAD superfamily